MRVPILKPFLYSTDGVNQIATRSGQVCDIPDHLVDGLKAEAFVGAPIHDRDPVAGPGAAAAADPAAREIAAEPGAPETKAAPAKKTARKK